MKQYYYLDKNQQVGPLPVEELKGRISAQTLVWAEGMADWIPAETVPDLKQVLVVSPPPPPGVTQNFSHDPFEFEAKQEEHTIHHSPPTISSEKIRKRWMGYNVSLWGSIALIPIIVILAIMAEERVIDDDIAMPFAVFLGFLAFCGFIATLPFGLSIIHKSWEQIQDGDARTEPGKAVGFLFIPYYNLYWIFVAYKGLAEDMNKYMLDKGYAKDKVANEGLVLTTCIFHVCMVIPYINILLMIPMLILHYVMMNNIKNATVYLIDHKEEASGETVTSW